MLNVKMANIVEETYINFTMVGMNKVFILKEKTMVNAKINK